MPPDGVVRLASRLRSKVDEDCLYPAVEVMFFGEAQLREDGVGMLLHRAFRNAQALRDRAVGLSFGHLAQDLGLARRQPFEIGFGTFGARAN